MANKQGLFTRIRTWNWKRKILHDTKFEEFLAKMNVWIAESKMMKFDNIKSEMELLHKEISELSLFAEKNKDQETFSFHKNNYDRKGLYDEKKRIESDIDGLNTAIKNYKDHMVNEEKTLKNKSMNVQLIKKYFSKYC